MPSLADEVPPLEHDAQPTTVHQGVVSSPWDDKTTVGRDAPPPRLRTAAEMKRDALNPWDEPEADAGEPAPAVATQRLSAELMVARPTFTSDPAAQRQSTDVMVSRPDSLPVKGVSSSTRALVQTDPAGDVPRAVMRTDVRGGDWSEPTQIRRTDPAANATRIGPQPEPPGPYCFNAARLEYGCRFQAQGVRVARSVALLWVRCCCASVSGPIWRLSQVARLGSSPALDN